MADLLIGADGVHSQVRDIMFRNEPEFAQPVFSGQLAYRLKCRAEDLPADHRAHSRFLIVCGLMVEYLADVLANLNIVVW